MPTFRLTSPDGKTFEVTAPDGATPDQVLAFAQSQWNGRTERAKAQKEADRKLYDPTAGQSFGENLVQGIGSGMTSALRAVGGGRLAEAMGLPSTKEEADQLNAPLANTTGGAIGQAVGMAAPAALAVPFTAATLPASIAAGAATGGVLTEGGIGDRLQGAALGGAGGAVAGAVVPVAQAVRGAYRGLTEPLTQAGRERIAGRAIERFSTNPAALQNLTNAPTATGARLTLPEATRDPGLATLQRAIGTMDPEASAASLARNEANNAARVGVIQDIAGDPAKRAAAETARKEAAGEMYRAATAANYTVDDQLNSLLQRPVVKQAMERAKTSAANQGRPFTFDTETSRAFSGVGGGVQQSKQITGQGLQDLKMALDDMLKDPASGIAGKEVDNVKALRGKIVDWMESANPDFKAARTAYAQQSKPINAMDVGQRLLDKTTANIRDLGGNQRLQANALSRALNDEETLLRQATGFRGNNALADVLDPNQLAALQSVRGEMETLANLNAAANGPGSQTAKMLASQNMLRQIAGPLGLPESWIESVLSQTALRPVQFGYKAAEPRIGAAVAEGLLDPARAQQLLNAARQFDAPSPPNRLLELTRRAAPSALGSYLAGQ